MKKPALTKCNPEWEDEIDISGEKMKRWVRKINDLKARCHLCKKDIKIGVLGITALTRYAEKVKHKKS